MQGLVGKDGPMIVILEIWPTWNPKWPVIT